MEKETSAEPVEPNSEYGTPVKEPKEPCAVENSLYNKCSVEMERLEAQNAEYREKLLRTIRERDLNEELLKNVQGQHKKEIEAQTKRIRDLEGQLKASADRATAQEAHFNVTVREMTQKTTSAVQQATRKAEQSEKEKNEAVVKYAMREGEMMKLREEIKTKDGLLATCRNELDAARRAQSQENVDVLEKSVHNLKVEAEKLKHERFDFENRMKIAEKRVETLTASLSETKQQSEVLRKQLIQTKDDKQSQYETKLQTNTADLEKRLREADSDLERLRTSQLDMATKFEEAGRENADLLAKIDILQDQLSLEEDRRKLCEEQIERLKGVESFVASSSVQIEESQKERESAEEEREQAEREASECRLHAEKMLRLTQELTERNMELQRQLQTEHEQVSVLWRAEKPTEILTSFTIFL
ncbi:unnamed protein product [Caenorhabditis sp. 36 PRJEB53466]|nr:unnamed protein product [Caenorhabditis sp. 36 PRJEB53466]